MKIEALSIKDFCSRIGISRSAFYRLRAAGTGPRVVFVGTKPLITHASASEWLDALDRQGGVSVRAA